MVGNREMYPCGICHAEHTSPLAAAECHDPSDY